MKKAHSRFSHNVLADDDIHGVSMGKQEIVNCKEAYYLFGKIQPIIKPYGISRSVLESAINRSLNEVVADSNDIRTEILPMIFRKVFDDRKFIWIKPQTPSGEEVSFEILGTAYAMWNRVKRTASRFGMDEVDAVRVLTHVVYVISGRMASGVGTPIRNIRKYMFASVLNEMRDIVANSVTLCPYSRKIESDNGTFIDRLESEILCNEVLVSMSPNVHNILYHRFLWDCNCAETAEEVGKSDGAVRKLLCVELRKVRKRYVEFVVGKVCRKAPKRKRKGRK
jgi:hypothetical protein